MSKSPIFLNAAMLVHEKNFFSCTAIVHRAGHGFSRAAERYRLVFWPGGNYGWWNGPKHEPANREARMYALLLAHAMAGTGDL